MPDRNHCHTIYVIIHKRKGPLLRNFNYRIFTPLVLFFGIISTPAFGQSLFENWFPDRSISIETHILAFKKTSISHSTGSYTFLNLSWQLNDKLRLIGDLPWIYTKERDSLTITRAYTLGNPYVGLEIRKPLSPFFIEAGIRFPVTHIYTANSQFSDYSLLYRSGAFANRTWTLKTLLNFHYESASGLAIRLRAGPRFLIPNNLVNPALLIDYSAQIRFKTSQFLLGAGYIGVLNVTKYAANSIHELVFEAMVNRGTLEPEFRLSLPHCKFGTPAVRYIFTVGMKIRFSNI